MQGFIKFIREQGVVGFAVGFILGGAVSDIVNSLVEDILNPILGVMLGAAGNLEIYTFMIGGAEMKVGSFLVSMINFLMIALVVYYGVKGLKLDKLDKKD